MTTLTAQLAQLRRLAMKKGCRISKSRHHATPNHDDHGEFRLVDNYTNMVILGARFDATLSEIEKYLSSNQKG